MCNTGLNITEPVPKIVIFPKELNALDLDTVIMDTVPSATLPHINLDIDARFSGEEDGKEKYDYTNEHVWRGILIMVLFFVISFIFVLAATFFAQACLNQF